MALGTTPRRLAIGAVIALSVAFSVTLSGCVAIAGNVTEQITHGVAVAQHESGVNEYKPAAGDCWTATYDGDIQYADWSTKPPISCSQPHQLYTFAVLQLQLPHSGSAFSQGYEKTAVNSDALNTCQSYQNREYGDAPQLDGLLKLKVYIPRNAQWNRGARWVRCDFNVFAVGSSITDPKLANLPPVSVITAQLVSDTGRFDYCIDNPNSTAATGPKVEGAVFASCTADPQWTLKAYMALPFLTTSTYPTSAQFLSMYRQQCEGRYATVGRITYAYYPTKSQWDSGLTTSECWAGHAS